MTINFEDVLTLDDDKKYVVTSKINFQEKEYLYLVDINNTANIKFASIENDDEQTFVEEVNDSDILERLIPLFAEDTKKILDTLA